MRPGRSGRAWVLTFSSARVSALTSALERCWEKCRWIPSRWWRRAHSSVSVPLRCFLEVDENVVPALGDAHDLLELGVEQVEQRKRALEEQSPGAQLLPRGA